MSIAFVQTKVGSGPIWLNVNKIVSLEPTNMGRETYVRTTSGTTFVLTEKTEEVLTSIREVMS